MSDSLSRVYDDYEEYKWLCKNLHISEQSVLPLEIDSGWYAHFCELETKIREKL